MATVPFFASKGSGSTAASTTTNLTLPIGHVGPGTPESGLQAPSRSAGTFSGLMIRVTANDRGASTLKFRTGGANGNQSVSIGASATGDFQDTTNTDAVAGTGELLNTQLITGAGGTVFTWAVVGILFAATTDTVTRYEALGAGTTIGTSTTQYQALCGLGSTQATEASEQFKIKTTGTLRRLFANIGTNTLNSAATTIRIRKNTANGNQSVSIGAGLTGIFEDTSNTDSVASGDLVNYQTVVAAPGTGTLTYGNIGVELDTTNSTFHLITATNNGASVNANLTRYVAPGGAHGTPDATEDNVKALALTPFTASNLECFVVSNTVTASSTVRTRKNGGNGNQSVSIGSSTTGYFEDTTNSDVIVATDYINYQIVTGATGTSLRLNVIGVLGTVAAGSNMPRNQMRRTYMPLLGR